MSFEVVVSFKWDIKLVADVWIDIIHYKKCLINNQFY